MKVWSVLGAALVAALLAAPTAAAGTLTPPLGSFCQPVADTAFVGRGGDVREPDLGTVAADLPASAKGRAGKNFKATVPVYVHVINKGQTLADGNVPDSQIKQNRSPCSTRPSTACAAVRTRTSTSCCSAASTAPPTRPGSTWRPRHERGARGQARPARGRRRRAEHVPHRGQAGSSAGRTSRSTLPARTRAREYLDGVVVASGSPLPGRQPSRTTTSGSPPRTRSGTGSGSTTRSRTAARPGDRIGSTRRASGTPDVGLPRGPGLVPGSRGWTRSTTTWTTPTTPATRSSRPARRSGCATPGCCTARLRPRAGAGSRGDRGASAGTGRRPHPATASRSPPRRRGPARRSTAGRRSCPPRGARRS